MYFTWIIVKYFRESPVLPGLPSGGHGLMYLSRWSVVVCFCYPKSSLLFYILSASLDILQSHCLLLSYCLWCTSYKKIKIPSDKNETEINCYMLQCCRHVIFYYYHYYYKHLVHLCSCCVSPATVPTNGFMLRAYEPQYTTLFFSYQHFKRRFEHCL